LCGSRTRTRTYLDVGGVGAEARGRAAAPAGALACGHADTCLPTGKGAVGRLATDVVAERQRGEESDEQVREENADRWHFCRVVADSSENPIVCDYF
jgi:hypothetical protein